jgi:hypothetical protein
MEGVYPELHLSSKEAWKGDLSFDKYQPYNKEEGSNIERPEEFSFP